MSPYSPPRSDPRALPHPAAEQGTSFCYNVAAWSPRPAPGPGPADQPGLRRLPRANAVRRRGDVLRFLPGITALPFAADASDSRCRSEDMGALSKSLSEPPCFPPSQGGKFLSPLQRGSPPGIPGTPHHTYFFGIEYRVPGIDFIQDFEILGHHKVLCPPIPPEEARPGRSPWSTSPWPTPGSRPDFRGHHTYLRPGYLQGHHFLSHPGLWIAAPPGLSSYQIKRSTR